MRLLDALTGGESPKFTKEEVATEFFNLEHRLVRERILGGHPRIDGRDTKTVRPISIRTGVLARTHGSALFTRGETQALVVTTLGTGRDAQIIDGLTGERKEPFMLHYNFPPFSVGRDRHDGFAEAARDRPRQFGQARRQGGDAGSGEVSVRHSRGVRDPRVQRLEFHGLGVRHQSRADGCGRADQGAGGRAWRWAW